MASSKIAKHWKCRAPNAYPGAGTTRRFVVPDEKVAWSIDYPEYKPPNYTSERVVGAVWADDDIQRWAWPVKNIMCSDVFGV